MQLQGYLATAIAWDFGCIAYQRGGLGIPKDLLGIGVRVAPTLVHRREDVRRGSRNVAAPPTNLMQAEALRWAGVLWPRTKLLTAFNLHHVYARVVGHVHLIDRRFFVHQRCALCALAGADHDVRAYF